MGGLHGTQSIIVFETNSIKCSVFNLAQPKINEKFILEHLSDTKSVKHNLGKFP